VGFPDPVVYEPDREVMVSGLGGGGRGDLGAGITSLPLPLKVFGFFFLNKWNHNRQIDTLITHNINLLSVLSILVHCICCCFPPSEQILLPTRPQLRDESIVPIGS